MTLPNFLLIGAAKSGTTSLYKYMRQHPQIYMPELKEPDFFMAHGMEHTPTPSVSAIGAYEQLFAGHESETALGEASATYLCCPWAPELIKEMIPDVKMIAILRNPVDRAWSHYTMDQSQENPLFSEDFQQAITESVRFQKGDRLWDFGILSLGMYCQQLKRYYSLFDRDQLLVILHDDMKESIDDVLRKVFVFLDVDPSFQADTRMKHHVSRRALSKKYDDLFREQGRWRSRLRGILPATLADSLATKFRRLNQSRPALPQDARSQLKVYYKREIEDLQELLAVDLSSWLA